MPELPEVETMARTLSVRIIGREISSYRLLSSSLVKHAHSADLQGMIGRTIARIGRRGKIVIIAFEDQGQLLFHPKMTGHFFFSSFRQPAGKHTHFCLAFKGYSDELCFNDVRKFGYMCYEDLPGGGEGGILSGLGPEPLDLDVDRFQALLASRRSRLKSLLLDQSFIAGVGNIYADEILFRAGLHPFRTADAMNEKEQVLLWRAMIDILQEAIALGGTSIRNYVDAEGKKGEYQLRHKVYGRVSQPCLICGSVIQRESTGGRSTHFCPKCQV